MTKNEQIQINKTRTIIPTTAQLQAVSQFRPGKVNSPWSQEDSKTLLSSQSTHRALFASRTPLSMQATARASEPTARKCSGICQGWFKPGSARTTWLLQNSSGVPALPPPPHDTRRCLSSLDAAGAELIVWSHNLPHWVFTAPGSPFTLFHITCNSKVQTKSIFLNCFMMTVIYCITKSERTPQK